MTVPEILDRLRNLGVNVRTDGSRLIVAPRDALTDELRTAIRANKPALVAALAPAGGSPGSSRLGTTQALVQTSRLSVLEEEARERRRAQALRRLAEHPDRRVAFVAGEEFRGLVAVMLAIRTRTAGSVTGELVIDKSRWDPWLFPAMLEQLDGAKPS
jgi:tubulysin polyketide synthase-like protein